MQDEIHINGKTYKRINGKWTIIAKSEFVYYNGKTYRKIFDGIGIDPKEACINKCCFCEKDENGDPCCGGPDERFWGCHAGFHWEET